MVQVLCSHYWLALGNLPCKKLPALDRQELCSKKGKLTRENKPYNKNQTTEPQILPQSCLNVYSWSLAIGFKEKEITSFCSLSSLPLWVNNRWAHVSRNISVLNSVCLYVTAKYRRGSQPTPSSYHSQIWVSFPVSSDVIKWQPLNPNGKNFKYIVNNRHSMRDTQTSSLWNSSSVSGFKWRSLRGTQESDSHPPRFSGNFYPGPTHKIQIIKDNYRNTYLLAFKICLSSLLAYGFGML